MIHESDRIWVGELIAHFQIDKFWPFYFFIFLILMLINYISRDKKKKVVVNWNNFRLVSLISAGLMIAAFGIGRVSMIEHLSWPSWLKSDSSLVLVSEAVDSATGIVASVAGKVAKAGHQVPFWHSANNWRLFFYLVVGLGVVLLGWHFRKHRLFWPTLSVFFGIFLAYKAELLSIWAFLQVPYTIVFVGYAIFRSMEAYRDKQWYQTLHYVKKEPTHEYSKLLRYHSVMLSLWICVSVSVFFVWKANLLLKFVGGAFGVFLTIVYLAFIWRFVSGRSIRRKLSYRLAISLPVVVLGLSKGLPLIVVVLALLAAAYLLGSWLQVLQGFQFVPFCSGRVRKGGHYFLWRRETQERQTGGYPIKTGEILQSFRGGNHIWLIPGWWPKQFNQLVIFPMEQLAINPWLLEPVAIGLVPWPESDIFDAFDITDDKKDELDKLGKAAIRAITEVVWKIGITVFLFIKPETWFDLNQEDRDDFQQLVKDRVQAVVNTFAKRMTLYQGIMVNLLAQDIKVKIGGKSYTLKERIEFVLERDLGFAVQSIIIKDGDQTEKVKALQNQLAMMDDEIAIEAKRVKKAVLIGQQAAATASEAFRGFAAFVVGKKPDDLSKDDLTPEVISQASALLTAWRLTEPDKDGGQNTKLVLPADIASYLGAALSGRTSGAGPTPPASPML